MRRISTLGERSRPSARTAPAEHVLEPPRWSVLCPEGTVTVAAGGAGDALSTVPSGTPVAVVASRPFSRAGLRRQCRRAGVRVDRELVALPSADRPLVLFDDDPRTVRRFWTQVAAMPPAPGWVTAAASLALGVAARAPWQWTGALAPGRIVLGVRR